MLSSHSNNHHEATSNPAPAKNQDIVIYITDKKPSTQPMSSATQRASSTQHTLDEEICAHPEVEVKPTPLETIDRREKFILPLKTLSDSIAHGLGVSFGCVVMLISIMEKSPGNLLMLGIAVIFAVSKACKTYREDAESRANLIESLVDERKQLTTAKTNLEHQKIIAMTKIFKCYAEYQYNHQGTEDKDVRRISQQFINTTIKALKEEKIIQHDVDHKKLISILDNMYHTIKMNSEQEYNTDDIHFYLLKNSDWQEKLLEKNTAETPDKKCSPKAFIQYITDTAASNYSNVFSIGGLATGFGVSVVAAFSISTATAALLQRGINHQNSQQKARETLLKKYHDERITTEETAFKIANSEEDFTIRSKHFLTDVSQYETSKHSRAGKLSSQRIATPYLTEESKEPASTAYRAHTAPSGHVTLFRPSPSPRSEAPSHPRNGNLKPVEHFECVEIHTPTRQQPL